MLTIDEKTIIKMYMGFSPNRDKTLSALEASLPLIDSDDIKNTVLSTMRKIRAMSNDMFNSLDLTDTMDIEY